MNKFMCKLTQDTLKFSLRALANFSKISWGHPPDPLALACYAC